MTEEELSLTGQQNDLSSFVSDEGGIWSLRQVEKVRGWNNIEYGAGLSGKNTPSTGLSMNRAYIPPGGIAKAHIHVDFDVMIYLLKGSVRHEYGPGCRKSVVHSAGDMFYIEPGLPHEVFNTSDTEWVHAIVSRSDASEWQNIAPYDRESSELAIMKDGIIIHHDIIGPGLYQWYLNSSPINPSFPTKKTFSPKAIRFRESELCDLGQVSTASVIPPSIVNENSSMPAPFPYSSSTK